MNQQEFSRDEIRRAVREALLEALPPADKNKAPYVASSDCPLAKQILACAKVNFKTAVTIDLGSNSKVNEFANSLAKCLQDQNMAALIRSGRVKFQSSAETVSGRVSKSSNQSVPEHGRKGVDHGACSGRMESGVLTESKVMALAKNQTSRIEVSRGVILTPLARDRARQLNIQIVRQ